MAGNLEQMARQAADAVRSLFQDWREPAFFLQCGSGFSLDALFDEEPQAVALDRLPGMPDTMTPDQEHPQLLFGTASRIPVLVSKGHRHLYEGLGVQPCTLPVCMAHFLNIRNMVLIDSGLSLNSDLKPGKWLMLTDFMNRHPCSPLDGNQTMLENPFPDMTEALSQPLNSELMNALAGVGISPMLGVFLSAPGSQFCTVSEAVAARNAGADIIGHDLVMEIIMGHALGMRVSAFALAALAAPDYYSRKLSRKEMLDACAFCSYDLMRGLRKGLREFISST